MRALTRHTRQDGSIPMALLVAIIVAGLVTVLTARIITGERQVRFDRSFTDSFHTADAGVQEAVFELNTGLHGSVDVGDPPIGPFTETVGDNEYSWTLERTGDRTWVVTSQGTDGEVSRTVTATVTEEPRFFPGAFGDTLIAFNGSSTRVDSYNSGSCTTPAEDCQWGTDPDYGTGNGAVATNGAFDFSGNPSLREASAFLYDWLDNPANAITESDPFGDRCDGNPCTNTYVRTVDKPLDYASNAKMAFVTEALGDCDGSGQDLGAKVFGSNRRSAPPVTPLAPYEEDSTWAVSDPTDPDFVNYYCADSLQFRSDTALDALATREHPVVIFVRDFVTVENQVKVACEETDGSACPNSLPNSGLPPSDIRPRSARLQIYVEADAGSNGVTGSNVSYASNSVFAGVVYAPRSRCGGPGGATVDIFGAIICGSMDNVGNWRFHFDDWLGKYGTHQYGVTQYTEEPSVDL